MDWKTWLVMFLAIGAAWMLAMPAAAGLRCDSQLVGRGMTHYEVLEICGEPVFEFGFIDSRAPGVFVRIDEWTYELGRNKFRRLLIFENGRLRRIETRDKPSGGALEATSAPLPPLGY